MLIPWLVSLPSRATNNVLLWSPFTFLFGLSTIGKFQSQFEFTISCSKVYLLCWSVIPRGTGISNMRRGGSRLWRALSLRSKPLSYVLMFVMFELYCLETQPALNLNSCLNNMCVLRTFRVKMATLCFPCSVWTTGVAALVVTAPWQVCMIMSSANCLFSSHCKSQLA